ncbi:MAG: M1 family metallopeptidase [Chloroflexota bacterium]
MTTSEFSLLPQHVRPLKYRLTLTPDMERFTFRGEETVDIEVTRSTREIVLNAIEIKVLAASVVHGDGTKIAAEWISYDESAETVTFTFGSPIPVGTAQLVLRFTGELNDRLHGFYRSSYKTPKGETRTLAVTQFEATDARRAFPCWDEPGLKATFELAMVIPSHLTAVSNTPVARETRRKNGTKRVLFRETPRMSTYLLAFVVGEMDSIEGKSSDGTVVRVWTTPGRAELGRFALDVAIRLLPYYNSYFGIPYPLEKLDHLAIPDFAAGAMENWGAITYRETALLFDPKNSAPGTRQRIAEVVAHEMAHMWFGDLVTMAWWNDLWLNESFASWMATKAMDHLFPEWEMWTQFIMDDVNAGLGLDGLENSHPIEADVRNPAEVSQLFDAISYSKGASILRMLEQFLGEEQFRQGLHRYLSAHTYENARTRDLWQAMENVSGQPVTAIMDSWVGQTGYPVINADIRRRAGRVEAHLSQQRFLYSGASQDPTLWRVPIRVSAREATQTDSTVMEGRETILRLERALPKGDDNPWVKINPGHTGFYRVQYTDKEWDGFIPAIEAFELPPADRLGLQSDAYALARAGLLPATQFLRLAQAYKNEYNYGVWADLAINLRQLDHLISQESFYRQFQVFGRDLLRPIARKVGWDAAPGEGHLDALLRSTVLGQLGAFGDPETLAEAQDRFQRSLDRPSSLVPDLRAVVYALTAQTGDQSIHHTLRRLAREATLQEEKNRLHGAMARFTQRSLLEQTLEMSLSPEVRPQDTVALVGAVASNPYGGTALAWEYVKANWPEFNRRYGAGGFAMMRLVGITGGFTTGAARRDVDEFFESHPTPAATRTIQQSLERIGLNVRWLERNRADLARWLAG